MKKLLNTLTSWLGWAFIEIADRMSPSRASERLYDMGCDLYGWGDE